MCVFIGGVCLSRTLVASLLLCNVVNWTMSDVQVKCMPICSFYIKTNIVIPTCTSDRFPPVLPSLAYVADIEELTGKGDWNLFLPDGLVARHTIQAAGSNYPKFRVKMFGMSIEQNPRKRKCQNA